MSLINFFDNLRFWKRHRNPLLDRLKLYGIFNRIVDVTANAVLSIWFFLTANNPSYRIEEKRKEGERVIVSLTSFPLRLPRLWLGIESIMRQKVKPDRLILYLTASQVGDLSNLPMSLKRLQKRGLEIRLCPDEIRSHTKYFYAMQEFPDDIIVTVDDDLFYRDDLIETHLHNMRNHPGCVVSNWCKRIVPGKYKYNEWPDANEPEESRNLMILGVSSVLYPPHSIHNDAFDVDSIKRFTLTADDVWLSAMLLKQGTPVFFSAYDYHHLPVRIKNNQTLLSGNYVRNQQCVDAIDAYYRDRGEEQPFRDIPKRINN